MTNTSEGRVTTEARGHVCLIGIDRTAKMNAFDLSMLHSLSVAYSELDNNEQYRCGVVFAHGDHFTAGLDLASVAPAFSETKRLLPEGHIDPWGVHGPQCSKPVVLAVQGRCYTLGIELALASEVCIAADDTRFAQLEVKRGIFPFGGATIRMVQACGWGNAMRYLLTGDEFDAAEAYRIGLVQEVVPKGSQLDRAIAIAETIAAQAPRGVRTTLGSARLALREGPVLAAQMLMQDLERLMRTEDAQEGLASFLERRPAKFNDR